MPLATKQDLKRVPVGTDVTFTSDDIHLHAVIQGKEYIAQKRDENSWILVGKTGVVGMLVRRNPPSEGYRAIPFKHNRMEI